MTAARRAALSLLFVPGVAAMAAPWFGSTASAQGGDPTRHGTVILFVVDRISFEELLRVDQFRALARSGGAALMASNENHRTEPELYGTIAAGRIPGPSERPALDAVLPGVDVCFLALPDAQSAHQPGRGLVAGDAAAHPCGSPRRGGDRVVVVDPGVGPVMDLLGSPLSIGNPRLVFASEEAGRTLARVVGEWATERTLVIVVTPSPSRAMNEVGDEVTPIVMASGDADGLLAHGGSMGTLTSDTTRQAGLVANVDVAPTIAAFFGVSVPASVAGAPIRLDEAAAPFGLHRRHVEQRRIRVPIQFAEVAFIAGAGLATIALVVALHRRVRVPRRLLVATRFAALCGVALPIMVLVGGLLPRFTYAVVLPFLAIATVGLAVLATRVRAGGTVGPFVALGCVGLAVVGVDAAFGGRALRMALFGGTMFDGVRFYGLPNAFIALVLASALFVAFRLGGVAGFALVVAAGLFAGFPSLGANLGGAVALFVAAGVWLAVDRRLGPAAGAAMVVGVALAGTVAVLLVNRFLSPVPTHVTRFVEVSGGGVGGIVSEALSRLRFGVRQVARYPVSLLPLAGLPIVLWMAAKRVEPAGSGLALAGERWRTVLLALTTAAIVSFFVEDTGHAAAAPVFLYAMAAMAYPAFLAAERRLDGVAA